MSAKRRYKAHGDKREAGGYVPLPHAVLRSAEFAGLSPFALKLLFDLLAQYRGDNNGDLCAAWTLMRERGWRSKDSLGKGLSELREKSFAVTTRQGGRHLATLFAVTFFEIDFCAGKLDLKTPSRAHMGTWRRLLPPLPAALAVSLPRQPGQSTPDCPAGRVNLLVAA